MSDSPYKPPASGGYRPEQRLSRVGCLNKQPTALFRKRAANNETSTFQ